MLESGARGDAYAKRKKKRPALWAGLLPLAEKPDR